MWFAVWPGRVHGLEGEFATLHQVAMGKLDVWFETMVGGGIQRIDLADRQRPGRTVRTFGEYRCARDLLEPGRERRMVDMRVGYKDVRDVAPADGAEQRLEMRFVRRAGIDDHNAAAAGNIGIGAMKGERTRIVGGHAQNIRRRFHGLAVGRFESGLEFRRFHDFMPSCVPIARQVCLRVLTGDNIRNVERKHCGGDMNPLMNGNALATTLAPMNTATRYAWLAFLALAGTAIITVAAKVQVPFWPVPATLQTLAIFTLAAAYRPQSRGRDHGALPSAGRCRASGICRHA